MFGDKKWTSDATMTSKSAWGTSLVTFFLAYVATNTAAERRTATVTKSIVAFDLINPSLKEKRIATFIYYLSIISLLG